jgi:hypothetical protein
MGYKTNFQKKKQVVDTAFSNGMNWTRAYMDVMNETALSFTSRDAQVPFRPQVSDPVNGNLGDGEVAMDQIMNLLNSK